MRAAPYLLAAGEVEAIGWLLIILVIVVLLFVAAIFIRKHFREDTSTTESAPFDLGDLKSLVRQGKLTQEEYDRLRAQMVEKLKPTTLSLPDLRRMLQNGEIGPDEYERLKAQVIAAMKDSSVPYPDRPKPKDPGQANP